MIAKMLRGAAGLGLVLTGSLGHSLLAAQVVSGRVIDGNSASAIQSVLVQVLDTDGTQVGAAFSGSDGRFRVELSGGGGVFQLRAETLLHHPSVVDSVQVGIDEMVVVPDIVLELAPILLEDVRVEVERSRLTPGSEWVRRNQLHGTGTILPGALFAASSSQSLGAYVAAATDLWLRFDARGRPRLLNPGGGLSQCVDVFVNRWPLGSMGFWSIDEIPRDQIAAIEIYEADRDRPPGYYFDGRPGCGLVSIWLWNAW